MEQIGDLTDQAIAIIKEGFESKDQSVRFSAAAEYLRMLIMMNYSARHTDAGRWPDTIARPEDQL